MTFRLKVEGMSCVSCVGKVQRALAELPGVEAVTVDREKSLVEVEGKGEAKVAVLLEQLEKIGYPGTEISHTPSSANASQGPDWLASTGLALAVMVVLMLGEWVFDLHHQSWFEWTSFALSLIVLLGPGRHFFQSAWRQARRGESNMDTLVSIGSGAAFALSVYGLFWRGSLLHLYFLESSAIIALISLGHTLESLTTQRAAGAVRRLLKETPGQAFLVDASGREVEVSVESLIVGNRIAVRPGGRIPVDGVLLKEAALLDESMVTGESRPVRKEVGAMVLGGTLNVDQLIHLEVRAVGAQTALARIVQLVAQAQQSRAAIQRLADKLSSLLVVGVIIMAILTVLGWVFGGHVSWEQAIIHAVSVVVVACPCAMGLATPAALMVAVSLAARRGVLIRGAEALEKCGRITAVLFDKTGTLTEAEGEVEQISMANSDPVLIGTLAKAMAKSTTHPIGKILGKHFKAAADLPIDRWQEIRGSGVTAEYLGQTVRLGSSTWLQTQGVGLDPVGTKGTGLSLGSRLLAWFIVRSRVKTTAAQVVDQLRAQGLKVFMVTGDRRAVAEEIAQLVHIPLTNVLAEVPPEKKAEAIKVLQEQGEKVAFVGDGINDAPALAQAELGFAVMGAADLAREAADIILLRQDIEAVPEILALSGATMRTIQQNFFWALGYNGAAVPLAMAGFMSPIICAAAMGLSDLCVVGNSLRLFLWRPKK